MEGKPSQALFQLIANSYQETTATTIILGALQPRIVPKRNGKVELHAVPHGYLLPLLRHDIPIDLRSGQLSGPRRPVRLQALHSRQLLLRNRPLRS